MEPKLIRKDIKYQKKTLAIVSVLVISLFIGGSFALLSSSDEIEEVVTFKTGNFNLEAATTGTLSLDGEVSKSYDDGFKNNDITLTLTNTGSLEIGKYDVKLEGDTGTNLDANYIRYSVSDDDGKTYLASKLLSETNNIIYTGYNLKTTKVLKVKLWIDEGAGSNALKKSYNGKINVELYQNDDTLVDIVKSKLVSNYSGSNESFEGGLVAVNNDGNLYHETNSETVREYRYSGPIVNNYVTFNDETWRIVGVFKDENGEEHIKIVRNEILTRDKFPEEYTINGTTYKIKYASDDLAHWGILQDGTTKNDWSSAGLQYYLNTKNDTEGQKGYLSYVNSNSLNMIEKTKYYLGTVTYNFSGSNDGIIDTPKEAYSNERAIEGCEGEIGPDINSSGSAVEANESCRVWKGNKSIWQGDIALLYTSDYGLSTNCNYWNTKMWNNDFNRNVANTSWLQAKANHRGPEWVINPATQNSDRVAAWTADGYMYTDGTGYRSVRPCLYLKNEVKITSGTGEESNPYKLSVQ